MKKNNFIIKFFLSFVFLNLIFINIEKSFQINQSSKKRRSNSKKNRHSNRKNRSKKGRNIKKKNNYKIEAPKRIVSELNSSETNIIKKDKNLELVENNKNEKKEKIIFSKESNTLNQEESVESVKKTDKASLCIKELFNIFSIYGHILKYIKLSLFDLNIYSDNNFKKLLLLTQNNILSSFGLSNKNLKELNDNELNEFINRIIENIDDKDSKINISLYKLIFNSDHFKSVKNYLQNNKSADIKYNPKKIISFLSDDQISYMEVIEKKDLNNFEEINKSEIYELILSEITDLIIEIIFAENLNEISGAEEKINNFIKKNSIPEDSFTTNKLSINKTISYSHETLKKIKTILKDEKNLIENIENLENFIKNFGRSNQTFKGMLLNWGVAGAALAGGFFALSKTQTGVNLFNNAKDFAKNFMTDPWNKSLDILNFNPLEKTINKFESLPGIRNVKSLLKRPELEGNGAIKQAGKFFSGQLYNSFIQNSMSTALNTTNGAFKILSDVSKNSPLSSTTRSLSFAVNSIGKILTGGSILKRATNYILSSAGNQLYKRGILSKNNFLGRITEVLGTFGFLNESSVYALKGNIGLVYELNEKSLSGISLRNSVKNILAIFNLNSALINEKINPEEQINNNLSKKINSEKKEIPFLKKLISIKS